MSSLYSSHCYVVVGPAPSRTQTLRSAAVTLLPRCQLAAITVPSQCHHSAITVPSQCHHSAITVPSRCHHGAITVPSRCNHSVAQQHSSVAVEVRVMLLASLPTVQRFLLDHCTDLRGSHLRRRHRTVQYSRRLRRSRRRCHCRRGHRCRRRRHRRHGTAQYSTVQKSSSSSPLSPVVVIVVAALYYIGAWWVQHCAVDRRWVCGNLLPSRKAQTIKRSGSDSNTNTKDECGGADADHNHLDDRDDDHAARFTYSILRFFKNPRDHRACWHVLSCEGGNADCKQSQRETFDCTKGRMIRPLGRQYRLCCCSRPTCRRRHCCAGRRAPPFS